MPHQRPLFVQGRRYRAKATFSVLSYRFEAGEVLVFVKQGYTPYDESFVYSFKSVSDGTEKAWALHDSEPDDTWTKYFELVP
jgi:hypothetical protein